jgi:hypothetical protein
MFVSRMLTPSWCSATELHRKCRTQIIPKLVHVMSSIMDQLQLCFMPQALLVEPNLDIDFRYDLIATWPTGHEDTWGVKPGGRTASAPQHADRSQQITL